MPIELITGAPGAGKTLYAVSKIRDAVKEGRPVYTNIDGLKIAEADPLPDDWREAPDGSLIVIDECHQRWPATGRPGRTGSEEITALDEHRHRGFDFLLMTQYPTKVHHQVREHINYHRHLMRPVGLNRTTIYTWGYPVLNPNDRAERDQADVTSFPYDKSLFSLYKSATIHTVKRQIPTKLKLISGLVVGVVALIAWNVTTSDSLLKSSVTPQVEQPIQTEISAVGAAEGQAVPPPPPREIPTPDGLNDWTFAHEVKKIAGCIWSSNYCRCYGEDGRVLDMPESDCRVTVSRPLPFALMESSDRGNTVNIAPAPSLPSLDG